MSDKKDLEPYKGLEWSKLSESKLDSEELDKQSVCKYRKRCLSIARHIHRNKIYNNPDYYEDVIMEFMRQLMSPELYDDVRMFLSHVEFYTQKEQAKLLRRVEDFVEKNKI